MYVYRYVCLCTYVCFVCTYVCVYLRTVYVFVLQLDTERLAVKEMKQRITSLQKNLEDQRQSATIAQQDSTRRRDHLVAQAEKKVRTYVCTYVCTCLLIHDYICPLNIRTYVCTDHVHYIICSNIK